MQKKQCLSKKNIFCGKYISVLFTLIALCCLLTSCGPSQEKITKAQQTYAALSDAHNAVVEAHKLIADTSYDDTLTALQAEAESLKDHNLYQMKDEEIDALIQSMESIISTYEEHLNTLTEVKANEDAAILVLIPVSLTNRTDFSFTALSFYEQGSPDTTNLIENLGSFGPTQALTGLVAQRDVENTPWLLVLTDVEEKKWELPLAVDTYTETGISLALTYDAEAETLMIGEYVLPVTEEESTESS